MQDFSVSEERKEGGSREGGGAFWLFCFKYCSLMPHTLIMIYKDSNPHSNMIYFLTNRLINLFNEIQ